MITAGGKLSETPSHPINDEANASVASVNILVRVNERIKSGQAQADRKSGLQIVVIRQVYDRINRHSRMLSACAA